jgi:DNA-binding Xre family transcriptional regulator
MANLAKMLSAYQGKYDIAGKDLAREIGVAASTLTRIKQGKMPDADGLARIILWMTKDG